MKSTHDIKIVYLNIQNLQKSFSAAQRSEEQLGRQANLPTHSAQAGARPREGCSLILHRCGSKSVHVYTAENIFFWAKRRGITLRLTIEQQDNQERQHNQATASHSWDWLWCQLGSVDLVREEDRW